MSQNPWSNNREFNTNSYYNKPPPQPVPPPASFTIGCNPYLAPQPVPPPSARPAEFGKPITSPVIQEPRGLPNKLYECQGTIVIYQPLLQCGIVAVTGEDQNSVYCFFLSSQACGAVQLRKGVRILTNARLVKPAAKVPYLASTLWGVGMKVSEGVMEQLLAPAIPEELEKYHNLSEDLSFELDDLSNKDGISDDGYGKHGYEERKRVASPDRHSMHSNGSSYNDGDYGKKSRFERTTPSVEKEGTTRSNILEEFPEFGVSGVVDKYLTSTTGVISLRNANRKVLFHANQVWIPRPDGTDSSPFLEVFPLIKLPTVIEVGQELKLNARRISGCNFNLQATAVWKRKDPPANYKSEELLQNLNLTLNQYIFCETGDSLYKTNPLAGTPDFVVSAKVQEYFSLEMGFLKLDNGDQAVVLFHLNQVWTEGHNAVPYRNVQDIILPEYLPIGSSVFVNMRKLQVSQGSSLKYQATLVLSRKIDEEKTSKLLPGYLSMYGPHDKRVSLVNELNDHHDQMKSILKLNMSSYAPDFVPVQAVLNGLPNYWQAQIVAAANDDYGIIRITHSQGLDLAPRVFSMYAVFHVEDVFDANGIPAIRSANVSMAALLDSHVDLTARPICLESEPQKILDLQRSFNEESVDSGSIPILQAIVVCVKMHPTSEIVFTSIPKPTPLRDHPGCFGSSTTEFYLNPTLNCKLNLKLEKFLGLPNKPNLPYRKKIQRNCYNMDEDLILKDIKKVDINKTERFLYGEFPSDIESLPTTISASLPKILDCHSVKLKYLHRSKLKSDCGVVEICINPQETTKKRISTYAFFKLHRYKFFTPKDCFATDLANIMPIYSKENFSVIAELAFPESKIPYVVHAIWNENLRQDLNAPIPQLSNCDLKQDKQYINSCSKVIADITNETQASVSGLTPIPPKIGRANKETESFEKSKVIMDRGKLVETLENMTGVVESILSHHVAIVTIKPKFSSVKYRVFCSSDDVFDLKFKERIDSRDFYQRNPVKFSSSSELWEFTARRRKDSLQGLLRPGQKVKLNAVPLFAYPNPADVHYVSSGVLVGKHSLEHPVPVHCIATSELFSNAWKAFFHNVVRSSLNAHGESKNKNLQTPPEKINNFLRKGLTGKMELREEYRAPGMGHLPTPVRTKQKVAKPVVWKDILNDQYGQVIRIMDKNYGIAAGFILNGSRNGSPEFVPFQMVFDTFDVYIGYYDCNELGKSLADVMQVGDYIKFNGVRVDPAKSGDARDIRYLATALVVAKTSAEVKTMKFPTDIAQIETIDQVAQTKIDNFKTVAGVMNTTRLSQTEKKLLDGIKSGKLGSKILDLSNLSNCTDDVLQESDGSDNEATCVEDYVELDKEEKEQIEMKEEKCIDIKTLVSELKPKELRKLIMSYIEVVTKLPEDAAEKCFDISNIVKTLNSEKSIKFFADFFISLGHTCKTAEKGIKVGHVFLTQTQVKALRMKGIASEDDIDMKQVEGKSEDEKVDGGQKTVEGKIEEEKVDGGHKPDYVVDAKSADARVSESSLHENVFCKFSTPDLRKFLLSFMKLIDKSTTIEEIAKDCNVSDDVTRKLLAAITYKCKESPMVEGKRQSFKLQNIFVNSTWVEKIVMFNFE